MRSVLLKTLACLLLISPIAGARQEDETLRHHIAAMSLETKVAQLFVVEPPAIMRGGKPLTGRLSTQKALERFPVGGLIYFSRHLEKKAADMRHILDQTQAFSLSGRAGAGLFICADEEGGSTSRVVKRYGKGTFPSAAVCAKQGFEAVSAAGAYAGSVLAENGFNMNLAPVADISPGIPHPMGRRFYSADVQQVSDCVTAFIGGLHSASIAAVAKHFPGLGSAAEDSHSGTSTSIKTEEELRHHDLLPFAAAIRAGVDAIMVSHITYTSLDEKPACLSPRVTQALLRESLHYEGLVITDSLQMKAITEHYSSAEAAVLAIEAGCDLLLMPARFESAYEGLLSAVQEGRISPERIDESVLRILRLKQKIGLLPGQ